MTDQQDLMARLLAEADRLDSWEFDHPDHYPVTAVALLREAAAQLGRVDLEEAARYGWEHKSWDWESVRIGIGERFNATPQLAAGVPKDSNADPYWRQAFSEISKIPLRDIEGDIYEATARRAEELRNATPQPDSAALTAQQKAPVEGEGREFVEEIGTNGKPTGYINFVDAYEGAREDLLDWKGRAQRAEAELRRLGYTGIAPNEPPSEQPAVELERYEDIEAIATCLDEDAAAMLEENPEDERAHNMQRASEILTALLDGAKAGEKSP